MRAIPLTLCRRGARGIMVMVVCFAVTVMMPLTASAIALGSTSRSTGTPFAPATTASLHTTSSNKRNIFMGAAINAGHILNAPDKAQYNSVAAAQYSLATAENGCKWGATEPQRGAYDFAQCPSRFCRTLFQIERAALHSYDPGPHSC